MQFTSTEFLLFLPVVFGVYWAMNRFHRVQNVWLLAASYYFYGRWDWRFLGLIAFSSLLDFTAARHAGPEHARRTRRLALGASLAGNLGVLGFFKYFHFFQDNAVRLLTALGFEANPTSLRVILPVGISFYTFQTLSYTIDVYRGRMRPTRDPVAFLAYVSFFPQLVAGPIERAAHLLPQFLAPRRFDDAAARDGLRLILWGLFKKVVVADACARMVNAVYANPGAHAGSTLWIATVCFAFQVYGDFSGYSDMARGLCRLFGFDLCVNFANPYFSRDPAEFWRRWHISLSSWFRDYVFIPLGGSRGGGWLTARNVMVTFLVSGLWHGASWNFVLWGALNGLLLLPFALSGRGGTRTAAVAEGRWLPTAREALAVALTFAAITVTWVFFRAATLPDAWACLARMFSASVAAPPSFDVRDPLRIALLVAAEWCTRGRAHPLAIASAPLPLRWLAYTALALAVTLEFRPGQTFIYFQF